MFQGILLESSPAMRRRNPWPMATAFTLQFIIATALIVTPLISTGIVPVSFHLATPPRYTPIEPVQPVQPVTGAAHSGVSVPSHEVVAITNLNPRLASPYVKISRGDTNEPPVTPSIGVAGADGPALPIAPEPVRPKPPGRVVISHLSEGMLLTKVVPEYPRIAKLAGVQGDVQLHAIIGKDGAIQSLTVTSGPAMLQQAAVEAVQQWKYRPYMLNGQPVEVDTVITVSFKRSL